MKRIIKIFTGSLLNWYSQHGRKDLPWQNPYSDYRVWLSEIMLQQTQVKTVIPYFLNFMARYPTIHALAHASIDDVLAMWSGLGYYSRARNLHRTAQEVTVTFQGKFPEDLAQLQNLPGIGRSTAAAIASLAFQHPTAILDGNVKRVLSRYFMISGTNRAYETQLWALAQACMPKTQCRAYSQAIMDMGALCCTPKQPTCTLCPLQAHCQAFQAGVVDQYPTKKLKKFRPIRAEQFLVFYTENQEVYLEQRPLEGIWGGLWCLPSISQDTPLQAHLKQTYDLDSGPLHPFMTYKHAFTHFHLHLTVYRIATHQHSLFSGRWFKLEDISYLGLAKPVKDILQSFFAAARD